MNLTPHNEQAEKLLARGIKAVLLVISLLGSAQAASFKMTSYALIGTQTKPVFAWCDAKDRILAVTPPSSPLSGPNDVSEVSLLRWLKNKPTQSTFKYKLGPMEGAAGSTYVGLIPAGFKATSDLTSKYFIHLSNVESPAGMGYRMQRVVRFKTMQGENACRYVPNAAFLGATGKRTVIVWDEGDTITYATRNFNGTPGVYVTGGSKKTPSGTVTYDFSTDDGYAYHLQINTAPRPSVLTVKRSGKTVQTETFLAYSVSIPSN